MLDPDPLPRAGLDSGVVDSGCPAVPCDSGTVCVSGECIPLGGCVDDDLDGYGPGCALGPDDCAEDDAAIHPGAVEACNGVDDDCDFRTDEDGVCAPCPDVCVPGASECSGERIVRCDDSSGCPVWTSPVPCAGGLACAGGVCTETCIDADADGFPIDCPGEREDCDDGSATTFPRAPEICDARDNDCDGQVDEGGVCTGECEDLCVLGTVACTGAADGTVECVRGGDGCTRFDAPRLCGSTRTCVDGACQEVVVCVDRDGDGAGPGCGTADCRPLDPLASPVAAEVCNGVDDDCDGLVDDGGVCATCPPATASAPVVVTAPSGLARVTCSSSEYFALAAGAFTDVSVVASGDADVAVTIGTLAAGAFTPVVEGWALGSASAATRAGLTGGNWAVRVTAAPGTRYVVAFSNEPGACVSDAFEPNASPASGSPLGVPPSGLAASLCSGDMDFYAVDVLPGQVVAAAAAFDGDPSGDALVKVWWNGAEVSVAHPGPFDGATARGRHTHFRADLPGSYVVGLRGATGTSATSYALAVQALDAPCTDDTAETVDGLDDDTLGTARALAPNATTTGVLCPGDFDVLEIGTLADGARYTGTLTITSGDTDVDFYVVRDSMRSLFHDGRGDGTVTTFTSNVSTAGRYYVVIHGRTPNATARWQYAHSVR